MMYKLVALICRMYYVAMILICLALQAHAYGRKHLLAYGKTQERGPADESNKAEAAANCREGGSQTELEAPAASTWRERGNDLLVNGLLKWIASLTVPKHWFSHFYMLGSIVSSQWLMDLMKWHRVDRGGGDGGSSSSSVKNDILGFRLHRYIDSILHLLGYENRYHGADMFVEDPHELAIFATGLLCLHIYIRMYECVVCQPKSSARMNLGHYILGLTYYMFTAVGVSIDSLYKPGWHSVPVWQAGFGLLLFGYSQMHQWRCHRILYNLRRSQESGLSEANPSSGQYSIPRGDWFEYVSCPHYLAEILLYVGLYIFTGFQSTTLLFAVCFIMVCLGVSSFNTHRWYRRTFGERYPARRTALIPGVW